MIWLIFQVISQMQMLSKIYPIHIGHPVVRKLT